MTDQEKRENVIKALELCASKIETRTRVPCEICPYHNEKYHGVLGDGCCNMRSLQRDMLALLKAQEPVKPIRKVIGFGWRYFCGKCGNSLVTQQRFCEKCGQAVMWSVQREQETKREE